MMGPPDTDLKRRVLASIRELPAPTRGEALRARAWILGWGVLGALVVFLVEGGGHLPAQPRSLTALTSVGTAIIVAAGMWLLLTRGRSALGRPAGRLATFALVTAFLFIAWRYGASALFHQTFAWPGRPGYRCLGLSVTTGSLPLLAALLSARRTVPMSAGVTGAAFGAGAGLGSSWLVDLNCPVSYMPHLLVGHLLPIGILALVGSGAGALLLRMRWLPGSRRCDGPVLPCQPGNLPRSDDRGVVAGAADAADPDPRQSARSSPRLDTPKCL
jgi:hypothetical protein